MVTKKRRGDDMAGTAEPKVPRLGEDPQDEEGDNAQLQGQILDRKQQTEPTATPDTGSEPRGGPFTVNIRIGSLKKAKQNDPKPPTKPPPESNLAPPLQIPQEMELDDIDDYTLKQKIKRLMAMISAVTVGECHEALLSKKENYDEAADFLLLKCEKRQTTSNASKPELEGGCSNTEDGQNQNRPIAGGNAESVIVDYRSRKSAELNEFAHLPWLETMEVNVTEDRCSRSGTKYRKRVAFCAARLIRRANIRGAFYEQMQKPFDEATLLAFDLFDRYGRLKDDYRQHPIRKGSGMWQNQLNDGDILLIEDVAVKEPYRRQGLGKKMINALLETTRNKTEAGKFVAILWPEYSKNAHFEDLLNALVGDSGSVHRPSVLDHHDSVAISWARSLGFRRIASSMWFGLLCEAGQPTPSSSVEKDYDPAVSWFVLHHLLPESILSASTDKTFLKAVQHQYKGVEDQDEQWYATDKERNTMLHRAALYFYPESVTWFMQQPFALSLLELRNSSGNTPLEALLQKLEINRTRSLSGSTITVTSDKFEGHPIAAAKCVSLLKGVELEADEDIEQYRYGCTCGACDGGFLSPRMNYALYMKSSFQHDQLEEELAGMSGVEWVESNDISLSHLPSFCRKYLEHYKAVRTGLVRLCGHITNCLLARRPPEEGGVEFVFETEDDEPAYVEKFFKCGGKIRDVMYNIFEGAMFSDDVYGDGFVLEMEEDCEKKEPKCRNDHEFVLVARMCGYEGKANLLSVLGQYQFVCGKGK